MGFSYRQTGMLGIKLLLDFGKSLNFPYQLAVARLTNHPRLVGSLGPRARESPCPLQFSWPVGTRHAAAGCGLAGLGVGFGFDLGLWCFWFQDPGRRGSSHPGELFSVRSQYIVEEQTAQAH